MFFVGSRKKQAEVSRVLCRLINQHSMERLKVADHGRAEVRFDLNLGVWAAPWTDGEPNFLLAFRGVTKNFNSRGIGLLVEENLSYAELLIRLPVEDHVEFIRARVVNNIPLGAGSYLIGLVAEEVIAPADIKHLDIFEKLLRETESPGAP